jgi:hypothetical protein
MGFSVHKIKIIFIFLTVILCIFSYTASANIASETFQDTSEPTFSTSYGGSTPDNIFPLSYNITQDNTNPELFHLQVNHGVTTVYYVASTCGEMFVDAGSNGGTLLGTPSDYFAFTNIYTGSTSHDYPNTSPFYCHVYIKFYDQNQNLLDTSSDITPYLRNNPNSRFEIKRDSDSGFMYLYINGYYINTIGRTLGTRPWLYSFYDTVNYGGPTVDKRSYYLEYDIDDLVQGMLNTGIVGTIPPTWFLKKDLSGYVVNGLYDSSNTVVKTTNFVSTYGRRSAGTTGGYVTVTPTNISLVDSTGTVWQTENISKNLSGDVAFNLNQFFQSDAPYGTYNVRLDDVGITSQLIYVGEGASVKWNKQKYTTADLATITYSIGDAYWDLSTFWYYLKIFDAYGNTTKTYNITSQSGADTYQWTTTNQDGVYYAEAIASYINTSKNISDIPMGYDICELGNVVSLQGYVKNARTGEVIKGANVTITQYKSTQYLQSSLINGSYSAMGFLTGEGLTVNTSASGYTPFKFTIIPLIAKTININISLVPTSINCNGICLDGVAMELPYYQPISNATVTVQNNTFNESYITYTNFDGYYIVDNLTNQRNYLDWGSKTLYQNSTIYNITVVGS